MTSLLDTLKGEPVAVAAALVAILQVVVGALSGNLDSSLITAAVTAVAGLFVRSKVSPVQPDPEPNNLP